MNAESRLEEARSVLVDLDLPRAQQNDRTALCLLALLDLRPGRAWSQARAPLMGITPIMDWARDHFQREYAPNTRETFRRQSMHQFMQAGICLYNPDDPRRPVNSPGAVYQIAPELLSVLRVYGTGAYAAALAEYRSHHDSLKEKYAAPRDMAKVPVRVSGDHAVLLSPGEHSELIKLIVEEFATRYVPGGGRLLYVGDTGEKDAVFDHGAFAALKVKLDGHGKLPDVVVYSQSKGWLFLIESVTSHGPVDHKRKHELTELFRGCSAGLVFVSAFPDARTFLRYLPQVAWETEVWLADSPTHMIHFNGGRFLGPY